MRLARAGAFASTHERRLVVAKAADVLAYVDARRPGRSTSVHWLCPECWRQRTWAVTQCRKLLLRDVAHCSTLGHSELDR
jgi:predicted RNA-binding Zn-ribbon protein involved in translation (DUF1610 family)